MSENMENEVKSKLDILKLEINILNSRLNTLFGNLWKVRQIGLTLWLAALGVGLGALSTGNIPLINILILSSVVPILFLFLDAKIVRWYFIYQGRDTEIQKFLSQEKYYLPSNGAELSFTSQPSPQHPACGSAQGVSSAVWITELNPLLFEGY